MPRKHKVLVADDSLTVRKMVEMLLLQEGYEVVLADTGAKCLALCASSTPDLLLLDFILPDMRGVDVCQALMNSPSTWEIPVLLMSGNGNAIRQLYQDMNNVADYLTKPFPPNVLKAVVAHVLQKNRPGTRPAVPPSPELTPQPLAPAQPSPATPSLFAGPRPDQQGTDAFKTPFPSSQRREAPEAVMARFRQVLQRYWRQAWQQIPIWERERGSEAPETYYANRFLAAPFWRELGSDLLGTAGLATGAPGAFRCPAALVPFDQVLQHLHTAKATGELRVELGEETVNAFFEAGEVVLIGSNHPRQYCAGAELGFNRLPHTSIASAIQAQELHGIPFFITLHQAGLLPLGPALEKLLRDQGERSVLRVYQCASAVSEFRPLDALPEFVGQYRLLFPVWQLLLNCYRKVDDWFTIEQIIPEPSAGLTPSLECQTRLRQLQLTDQENQLLQSISPSRTVQDIMELSNLGSYLASQVLFRFLRLGLFFSIPHPDETFRPNTPPQPESDFQAPLLTTAPTLELAPVSECLSPPSIELDVSSASVEAATPAEPAQEPTPSPDLAEASAQAQPEQPVAAQTPVSPDRADAVPEAEPSRVDAAEPEGETEAWKLGSDDKHDGLVSLEFAYDAAMSLKHQEEQKKSESENEPGTPQDGAGATDASSEPATGAGSDRQAA